MPFALIPIGLVMVVTGVNNTHAQFASQLKSDFTGEKNFTKWIIAIGGVGALGYIKDFEQLSRYFMALILIALLLSNRGVIAKFQEAIEKGPAAVTAPATASGSTQAPKSATTVEQQQSGAFGQAPSSEGQAKAFGWFNYFLGGGWLK